jgi:hypothetical protein
MCVILCEKCFVILKVAENISMGSRQSMPISEQEYDDDGCDTGVTSYGSFVVTDFRKMSNFC